MAGAISIELRPVARYQEDQTLAAYFRVLGEKHRLQIFKALATSELCVCELEEQMGISPSLLAHHLKVLRKAGLIHVRRGTRDARWLYYSVKPEAYASLCALFTATFPSRELPPQARCGSNCRCG